MTAQLAFVGAGALGQIFSSLLASSGQPVTLLGTPASVRRLAQAGAIRLVGVVEQSVPVAAAPAPAGVVGVTAAAVDLPHGGGLLFTTKGHQLAAAIEQVRTAWPAADDADAWVGGFQNGLAKDRLLTAAFGAARVVGAVTITGGQREADGAVALTARGGTYLGEFGAAPTARVPTAVALLNAAGLPTEASADIQGVLWSKAANAVGVFGVSVLTRLAGPQMMRRPDLVRAYLALIREVEAVAQAVGVRLGDYINFPIRSYLDRTTEENIAYFTAQPFIRGATSSRVPLPSMTADLLAGRPLEVDGVFDDFVQRAAAAGVGVPRIELVRDLIRGLDVGRYPGDSAGS